MPQRGKKGMKTRQNYLDLLIMIAKYVIIVLFVLFCLQQVDRAYELGYSVFSPVSVDAKGQGRDVTLTIPSDMKTSEVAKLLEDEGLVEDDLVFRVQERFSDYHGMIRGGTYTLRTDMLPEEILAVISDSGENTTMDGE